MRTSLVAALFACFLVVPLAAQDRMPPIATDQLTDAQKKAADEFGQGRGYAVRGPFVPLIRSPEVMLRAKAMGDYLRFKSTLGPRLNEMVILITARESPSMDSATDSTKRVFPVPVGPRNNRFPIGLPGLFIPAIKVW